MGDEDDPRGRDPHGAARLAVGVRRARRSTAPPLHDEVGSRTSVVAPQPASAASSDDGERPARLTQRAASATSEPASIGMWASRRVPSPGGLVTSRRPSSTARRSISPRRPVPPSIDRAALAVVGDDDHDLAALAADVDDRVAGLGVADDVGQALGDRRSRRRPRPGAGRRSSSSTVASTSSGARATSASTAAPTPRSDRNAGWMPRANSRSSASATASFSPISSTVVDEPAVAEPRLEHPQVEREADELLLGAVVQVALDPPAGVVGGLDDPQPRHPQLLDAGAQLGLQALVVDRQRGGRGGGGDELGRGVELGVVDDRGDAHAAALDRRPGAAGARVGQRRPGGRRRRRRSRARAASRRCSASGRRAARPAARAPGRPRPRASAAAGGRARAAPRRRPRARRSRRSWPAARAGTARCRPPGRAPTGRRAARRRPRARSRPSPASAIAEQRRAARPARARPARPAA